MQNPADPYTATHRSSGEYPPQATQPRSPDVRRTPRVAKHDRDVSMTIVLGAVFLILIPIGGLVFAINGGYSIIGLEVIANAFNGPGRFLWAAVSAVSFQVPVPVAGLPMTQPVIPWCVVCGTSVLQVVTLWRQLTSRSVPTWLGILTGALSLYDLATTFIGFSTIAWLAHAGVVLQLPLALLITFGFEGALSFLLRKV